jgi:GT2 family glycosyltransferase
MKQTNKKTYWVTLLVLVCILFLGSYLRVRSVTETVVVNPLRADAGDYFRYAYNVLYKNTYSREVGNLKDLTSPVTPDGVRPPGYPLFLALFVDGLSFQSFIDNVVFSQAILSSLTIILAFLLFKSFLPSTWAMGASLLVAISPHLIVANSYILTETLFGFTLTVVVWLTGFLQSRPSLQLAGSLGLLTGLASLVRPSLEFFPLLLAVFLVFHFGWRRGRKLAGMVILGCALCLSPWVIRNVYTLGMTSDSTLTVNFLHHGIYPDFTYDHIKESRGFPYRYDPRTSEIGRDHSSVLKELSRRFREEPGEHLRWFLLGKLVAFWSWNTVQGVGDAFIYPVSRSPYFSDPFFRWSHHLMHALHWPAVTLAFFGCLMAWFPLSRIGMSENSLFVARVLSLLLVYFTALHMVGAPFPRYSFPLRPFLYGLALLPPYLLILAWRNPNRPAPKQVSHTSPSFAFFSKVRKTEGRNPSHMTGVVESMTDQVRPVCSICIANYNGREYLDRCIQSVQEQDCPFPIEIIIHDDASTDGSPEYVLENYPNVILIASKSNVGFCVSNNRMVARARGEYILLLNNDAELFPDALRTLHAEAVSQREGAILGLPQYEAPSGNLLDFGLLFDPFLNPVPNLDPNRREVGMVTGACLWVPKKLWEEFEGFPEWFQSLAEDMNLCCRARLRGYPVRVIPRSGFRHWVGSSLGGGKVIESHLSTTAKRRALSERNKSYVMAVCYPTPFFELLFSIHVLLLLFEGVVISAVKAQPDLLHSIYLPCLRSLWMNRHLLRRVRRRVQSSRRIRVRHFFSVFLATSHKLRMVQRYGLPEIR